MNKHDNDLQYICSYPTVKLTPRELECVKWSAYGKSTKEVAIELNISHRTVEAHLNSVKIKIGCNKIAHIIYLLAKKSLI